MSQRDRAHLPVLQQWLPDKDSNHRFVTSRNADAFMLSQGWSYEGVVMCSPIRAQ